MSDFSSKKQDASNPAFWNERFINHVMPWDKGGVPADLQHYFQHAKPEPARQCLIPGCGNGYEAAYLSELGWDVVAIDFSPAAVASARAVNPTWRDRIIEADFFSYQPSKPLSFIYERAFLCALPPALRHKIVGRWVELLPAGSLLLGYFFIEENARKSGPPFSITQTELNSLLSPHFVCLENNAVADSIPVFEGNERWQVWKKLD